LQQSNIRSKDRKAKPSTSEWLELRKSRRSWKHVKGALAARLGGILLRGLARIAGRLSRRQAEQLGRVLARVLFLFTPYRRGIAWRNLCFAFREKDVAELRRILWECYENFGRCLVEFLRLPKLRKEGEIHELVSLEGEEHLRRALARGRGVVLLTAHYGNWEMVGAKLAACGYPLNVLARQQRDAVTTRLVDGIRQSCGMRVLAARNGDSRVILACLRRGEIVGFLADQNAGRRGIFVDFFGRAASTFAGAALFALRTKAAVVPVFGLRNRDNTHTARLLPEVELIQTGSVRRDVEANTAAFTRLIEHQIRSRPGLWFWLHDRWRTSSGGKRGQE